jgi:alcohol dehydrogenase
MQTSVNIPDEFAFIAPTQITYGVGVSARVADEVKALGGTRPLVVAEGGIIAAGIIDPILEALKNAGMDAKVFDRFSPNPQDFECVEGLRAAKEHEADALIGVGGGSSMDMAKMIGALQTNGGEPADYEGVDLIQNPLPPLIVIPTTSGTGSEVTFCTVFTDNDKRAKVAPVSLYLTPKVALLDPALTRTVPPDITAATGLDAFCHAFESYTCTAANPITEALALYSMELVGRHLDSAVQDGTNIEARANLQIASTIAGIAFTNSNCNAVHALAESYGGMVDMPHGVACSIFLPYVFEFNMDVDPAKHARVGEVLGLDLHGIPVGEGARRTLEHLVQWERDLGIPRLKDIPGVDPSDFELAAQGAMENGATEGQLRPVTRGDYRRMYEEAYKA